MTEVGFKNVDFDDTVNPPELDEFRQRGELIPCISMDETAL